MSNPSFGLRPPHALPRLQPRKTVGARLMSSAQALLHGSWEFVKAVGSINIRDDMLEAAERVAKTQPELARRLRRAAHGGWF
jgi:hypothetical protein